MAFVNYTPSTTTWWDIVGTPLQIPSGNGDPYTYDNQEFSASASQGFKGKVLDNLAFIKTSIWGSGAPVSLPASITKAQELRICNKLVWSDTAASSSARLSNQSGTGTTGTIPAVFSRSVSIADWWWLALDGLPHGATLTSVIVSTLGAGADGFGSITPPSYQIVKYQRNVAEATLSLLTNDAHDAGNWTTTVVDTTISANANVTIDRAFKYALLCNAPKFTVTSSGVEIRGLSVVLSANAIIQLG